jgi:putative redox protein
MAHKTAHLILDGEGLRFQVRTGSGHSLVVASGPDNEAPTPAELVPVAVAGCTAMDVISILRKKRQVVTHYAIDAAGTQMEAHPNAFTRIDVTHHVEGPGIDVGAVKRAIELSATKYCSVGTTLASGIVEVRHAYRIVDSETGAETSADVLVEGPHHDPTTR